MPSTRTFAVAFLALLPSACADLVKTQPPDHRIENAHAIAATAVAFSPNGKQLASGGYQGEIALWRITPPVHEARLVAHHDSIRALEYVTQYRLVSSGDDGRIIVWDTGTLKPVAERKTTAVTSMSANPAQVITGHRDGSVRVWSFPALEPVRQIALTDRITGLARHAGLVAVATKGGRVALYDAELNHLRDLQASGPAARDIRFSPDGATLAAGAWFKLLVWDVATGKQQIVPAEHHGLLTSLDFSPDGKHLASIGRETDAAVHLWDRERLVVERYYQPHQWCGAMIRFSADGRYMASASDDESVRLYDLTEPASHR